VELLVEAAARDLLAAAHDCSDGGLAVALAECAIAGDTGVAVSLPMDLPDHVALFSESASRAVVAVDPARAHALEALCEGLHVPVVRLGETGGPRIVLGDSVDLTVTEARDVYESAIPTLMSARRAAS